MIDADGSLAIVTYRNELLFLAFLKYFVSDTIHKLILKLLAQKPNTRRDICYFLQVHSYSVLPNCNSVRFSIRAHRDIQIKGSIYYAQRQIYSITAPAVNLNDTGVIYQAAIANLEHTSFHFLVSDGPTMFITSDTPAFIYKRPDNTFAGLLPITPRILTVQGKNTANDSSYYVTHITDEAVQNYNKVIRENADKFIIINWQ